MEKCESKLIAGLLHNHLRCQLCTSLIWTRSKPSSHFVCDDCLVANGFRALGGEEMGSVEFIDRGDRRRKSGPASGE